MNNHSLLGKSALLAIAGCLLLTLIIPRLVRAQSPVAEDWEKAAGGKMSFDVASVKGDSPEPVFAPGQNIPVSERMSYNFPLDDSDKFPPDGGLLSTRNMFLWTYISFAYKLRPFDIPYVVNLPKWGDNARFEIEARAPSTATKDQMRLMMQSLLADRFKLAVHWENRPIPVYEMILAKPGKLGPQLWAHSDDPPCADKPSAERTARGLPLTCGTDGWRGLPDCENQVAWRNVSMSDIATGLRGIGAGLDRPLVDRTGLDGKYDFVLTWLPDFRPGEALQCQTPGPAIRDALNEQLGVKLESSTDMQRFLVIDHVEEPTPN